MIKYHKIDSIYKRDKITGQFLIGQWAQPEFEMLKNIEWVFTEKIDGTNIRIHWDGKEKTIAGRTENSQIPPHLFAFLDKHFSKEILKSQFQDSTITLFGEGYGYKIQKTGGLYCTNKNVSFCLFDAKVGDWWLQRKDIVQIASDLNIESAPIIDCGTLNDAIYMCKNKIKSKWGNFIAEGIVARPYYELKDRGGHRIITKIKCCDFENVNKT